MRRFGFSILGGALVCLLAPGGSALAQGPNGSGALASLEQQQDFVAEYCLACHNDALMTGGMSLQSFDFEHPAENAELSESIVRKLLTGLMPPPGEARPDRDRAEAFFRTIETQLDQAVVRPNPGSRPFQRLTRDEYANSIRDMLGIQVDVDKFLPADALSDGMDNIADSQTFSAALMEGYIRAAAQIMREALGDPKAEATSTVFQVNRTGSQLLQVEGAPFGTRGGLSLMYNFPADGEYGFRAMLHGTPTGRLFGNTPDEEIEVSVDGARVALLPIPSDLSEAGSISGLNLATGPVFVKAGPHRVSAAFIKKQTVIVVDDMAEIQHTLIDTDSGDGRELTVYPHIREFEISGPRNVSGVSDSAPRRRVFTCRPLSRAEEIPCAADIVRQLARKSYRRPVADEDMEGLMLFYDQGRRTGGDFEAGIREALQAMLTSPDFVFKFERFPEGTAPGEDYYIGDLALASRLSYFLWGKPPDDTLIDLADQGRLGEPVVLEAQVRRMLAEPSSSWLSTKFANLWLHLPDLENFHPEPYYFPQFDYTLALALTRETELFFDSIVREDRNVLDLLTADYTFVNERVAMHYGIPNVRGNRFRRVTLSEDYRRGLLGKAAILALTSNAERTSPVLRGKWVLGVLLGTPPPPPPPVVPSLEDTEAISSGKVLTVRERMELHRANPACNSCHRMIDPLGLALENFEITGEWRTWDKTYTISSDGVRIHTGGVPIDPTTELYDGSPLDGPASLRRAILKYSDAFINTLTENLLAFAVGRRVEYYDMPTIRAITRDAADNDNRFLSLILGIVKSPAFRMSRAPEPVSEANQQD